MKCSNCNNIIPDDSSFCNHCGNKIEKVSQLDMHNTLSEESTLSKSTPPKKPAHKQWWFWALMIYLFIGVVIGASESFSDEENPDATTTTTTTTTTQKGAVGSSKDNPYVLNAETWYTNHCNGTSKQNYVDKWVKITGTVLNISEYSGLKGYYLAGGTGKGLVCWVYSKSLEAQYGQIIEYVGKVSVQDSTHIEITDGNILSAEWPTQRVKSPVTMSDWKWSRDSVGGVEWSFRFTNNTDKVVKYITVKWNCYNAVGDLVYDQITGATSHGVTVTGPLNPRETTDFLCNSTKFYSYSFNKAVLSYMQVEFMDGTIIRITDKTYSDILVKELKDEVVVGSNGIVYVVDNELGTCYIENIGTCTNSYIGILSSLYGDKVTHIGDYAFADASFIETVSITQTLEGIGDGAFLNCTSLTKIQFSGNIEDWYAIEKGINWDKNTGDYIIYCNDGEIAKDGTVTYK